MRSRFAVYVWSCCPLKVVRPASIDWDGDALKTQEEPQEERGWLGVGG